MTPLAKMPAVCRGCAAPLVITRDAIGRPRYRCPECQGVVPADANGGLREHHHRQTATDSRSLTWSAPRLPAIAPEPRRFVRRRDSHAGAPMDHRRVS